MKQRRQRPIGPNDPRSSGRPKHGLSRPEIAAMLAEQEGRCAICHTRDFGVTGPVIDHDHALARSHPHPDGRGCRLCVRAVLCSMCNTVLGYARDDSHVLRVAAAYLDAWSARAGR